MEAASGSLFCFVNTNEITKMLFSFFPNYHSLSILNTVFSFFFNKHINFAAENVKSSLVYKVKPTEHKKPRWSNDMKSLTFK